MDEILSLFCTYPAGGSEFQGIAYMKVMVLFPVGFLGPLGEYIKSCEELWFGVKESRVKVCKIFNGQNI